MDSLTRHILNDSYNKIESGQSKIFGVPKQSIKISIKFATLKQCFNKLTKKINHEKIIVKKLENNTFRHN